MVLIVWAVLLLPLYTTAVCLRHRPIMRHRPLVLRLLGSLGLLNPASGPIKVAAVRF